MWIRRFFLQPGKQRQPRPTTNVYKAMQVDEAMFVVLQLLTTFHEPSSRVADCLFCFKHTPVVFAQRHSTRWRRGLLAPDSGVAHGAFWLVDFSNRHRQRRHIRDFPTIITVLGGDICSFFGLYTSRTTRMDPAHSLQ